MRFWFKSKKEIEAEEEQTFRDNLAKKLDGYQSDGSISNFSATDVPRTDAQDHTAWLNELYGDSSIEPDPRWVESSDPYVVEEVDITDLSEADLEVVARLRRAYLDNLQTRKLHADPDTKRLDAMIRGEDFE